MAPSLGPCLSLAALVTGNEARQRYRTSRLDGFLLLSRCGRLARLAAGRRTGTPSHGCGFSPVRAVGTGPWRPGCHLLPAYPGPGPIQAGRDHRDVNL